MLVFHMKIAKNPHNYYSMLHLPDKQTETHSIPFSFMAVIMFFMPSDKTVVGPKK
jgi:hypothetical protein